MIIMNTSLGKISIELDYEKAPISAKNIENYVKAGFYDGTIFHRVISDFMIQGGGMTPDMENKETNETIQNEADNGLKNVKGSLAMARTSEPHTASSQFFINLKDNDFLDHRSTANGQTWGYAVFGMVVEGMDVVEKIAAVQTGNIGYHQNVPLETILIESCSIE